jgi:hypothetical protein
MIVGMMILGVLMAVLAAGSLLTILIASVISARRPPSWHARCRVIGVSIHGGSLLIVGALLLAESGSDVANGIIFGLALLGITGTSLFAAGYLGQALNG